MLHCPAESRRVTHGADYKTIYEVIVCFEWIGCLPTSINLSRLNDVNGVEGTLQRHKARGTTHVGSSTTEQNYSVQRSVRHPPKMLLLTLLIAQRSGRHSGADGETGTPAV